tara:strand:- start:1695 stop:1964 length:270 start_codon:yes stop_codon:yes gene_type:complete
MSEIKVKVEANYNTTVIESDNPRVVARVLAIILDTEADEKASMTPEQTAIQTLKDELETLRSELSTANYYRDQAQKKLADLTPKVETEA